MTMYVKIILYFNYLPFVSLLMFLLTVEKKLFLSLILLIVTMPTPSHWGGTGAVYRKGKCCYVIVVLTSFRITELLIFRLRWTYIPILHL